MNDILDKIYSNSSTIKKIYSDSFLCGFLHKCSRYLYFYPREKSRAFVEYIESIPRSLGYNDRKYNKLKQLKDKYKGKRCFITCTGPSLTIEDLESLENEYVFGMNSICLIHDKTDWRPDFLGNQDEFVYEKIKDHLLNEDNGMIIAPYDYLKAYNTPKDWCYYHCCGAYHLYQYRFDTKYFAKFSGNAYARVYDGYSITHSLLQIAIYMGFDEIYLIGADCSYLNDKHHFIETGRYDDHVETCATRFFSAYKVAKKYTDRHGQKIINCTRGGALEIFPRENLEDVLARNEKNKTSE